MGRTPFRADRPWNPVRPLAWSHGVPEIEERLWWYRGRRRVCFELLDKFLPRQDDLEILDVGCGTGYNLQHLQRYGKARGVDMSEHALEFCRRRGLQSVSLHTAGELPFGDQNFDLLTAFDVIEHIPDDRAALTEFRRVLRPGGWLLIYTPALPWLYNEHDRIVHHQRRYMGGELTEKLTTAGYQMHHQAYVNGFVLPLVLLARLLAKFGPKDRHQEMEVPSAPINTILGWICRLEQHLVRRSALPIGMSLVALARKK